MAKVLFSAVVGIFLLSLVEAQDPTVKIKQTDPDTKANRVIVAERDRDVTMDCYVENLLDNALVRWQRQYIDQMTGKTETQPVAQDMALMDNIHFSMEKPTQYTWRLRIRGIQVADEGNYTCFVQLTQITQATDFRYVQVVIKPYLDPQQTSPDTTVDEGDNLDLVCNASGRPAPSIFWSRLGGALLPIGQEIYEGVVLKLRNIRAQDRGTYRCKYMNSVDEKTIDIVLGVRFPPYITVPRPVVTQAVGYRVEMQCFVEANPMPLEEDTAWLHDTTTYTMTSDRYQVNRIEGAFDRLTYELVITDVESSDYGGYSCRLKNDMSAIPSIAKITLQSTNVPQPSIKLNRVIKGNENPETSASVAAYSAIILSLVSFLLAVCIAW